MESSAAVQIWKRSIPTHNLVYGAYIGDGDSSYKNLVKSDPYTGIASVRKEECLGHVQKRLKKRLRKVSKDFKGLPDLKADRIAHMYALVIAQNRGHSPKDIHNALQILLRHSNEKHDTCPLGSISWCCFQRKISELQNDNSLTYPSTRDPYLTPLEFKRTNVESLRYMCRRDRLRNLARGRRIRETHKRRRRQIATQTKLAEASRKRRDTGKYSSEKYGSELHSSGDESDVFCARCNQRDCPIRSGRKYEQWVCCYKCEDWFHWGCVGIRIKRQLPEYFFCSSCTC